LHCRLSPNPGIELPRGVKKSKEEYMLLPVSAPSALSALTARQAKVALALAHGATITAAAAAAGLNRVTIHRWLHAPDFAQAVRHARDAHLLDLRDAAKNRRSQALAAVDALLADPQAPAAERLRLAFAILQHPLSRPGRPGQIPSAREKCNEM
jgi:hypothetical protein